MTDDDILRLRGRIAELAVSHKHIAAALGMHPSVLSRILRGKRPAPDGFVGRANAVLDATEQAIAENTARLTE